jgi:hypothetical protein
MAERKIPDRKDEPALQESLDHGPKSHTAANSDDVEPGAAPDARDDEGNLIQPPEAEPERSPDGHKVEEMTGVPESSEELSDI